MGSEISYAIALSGVMMKLETIRSILHDQLTIESEKLCCDIDTLSSIQTTTTDGTHHDTTLICAVSSL